MTTASDSPCGCFLDAHGFRQQASAAVCSWFLLHLWYPSQIWGLEWVYKTLQGMCGCCWWQECKVDKAVGAPTSEVLYVFDEANPVDPLSLASLIQVWRANLWIV